jgi:hypothetical protein
MSAALLPMQNVMMITIFQLAHLWKELDLPMQKQMPMGFLLQPDLEIVDFEDPRSRQALFKNPYMVYSAEDLAVLEDSAKRERFVEIYRDCLCPRYREFAEAKSAYGHLLDEPPVAAYQMFGGMPWSGLGRYTIDQFCAYSDAFAPILKRWEAGASLPLQQHLP